MSDIYLKIAEVDGDVTDDKYQKHIQVQSLSTGMSNPSSVSVGTQAGSAGGGGKVIMQDVHFTKMCDRASPKLWLKCAKGEHFKDFEFKYVISRGDSSDVFKTVKLTDVLVTSFQHSGSSGADLPMESISLNFAKVEISYKPRKPDGGFDDALKAGYDLKTAKPV
ncbi:MAG: type VI secretion system tube protein Hcp [Alphaproteobacteria bacterium]|nr:type VI secretion system tube protein Hcp [Alphaproteobacteria bacterium]